MKREGRRYPFDEVFKMEIGLIKKFKWRGSVYGSEFIEMVREVVQKFGIEFDPDYLKIPIGEEHRRKKRHKV